MGPNSPLVAHMNGVKHIGKKNEGSALKLTQFFILTKQPAQKVSGGTTNKDNTDVCTSSSGSITNSLSQSQKLKSCCH